MDKKGKYNISIRLDKNLFDQLHKECEKRNQTLSSFIKDLIYQKLEGK